LAAGDVGTLHRIGGATIDNLRLKPAEATMAMPGISVLKADAPGEAAAAMRAAFPKAKGLQTAAATVGSATEEAIRATGFDVMPDATARFPNHYRIIHPDGAAGFNDANLARLAGAFTNTTGH
jgi:hypothetical protein